MGNNDIANRLAAPVARGLEAEYRAMAEWDIAARPLFDAYQEASESGDRDAARSARAALKALGPRPTPGVR
jgi:hypothetical protein